LTWAKPEIGKTCAECKHCAAHPKPREFKPNVCQLVKAHTGRVGLPFMASKAISCGKYEENTTL
jgi:hypothetical protein